MMMMMLCQGSQIRLDFWATLQNICQLAGHTIFLDMTKYTNYFKQRYLGFELQFMLEIHVGRFYSTYLSVLTVTKRTG